MNEKRNEKSSDLEECLLNDNDLFIRLSIITQGNVIEQRREIRRSLVLAGLNEFNIGVPISLNEIALKIETITKCSLNETEIVQILGELIKDNIIDDLGSSRFKLISKKKIPDFSELTYPVWLDFQKFLIAKDSKYDVHIHKNLRSVFENILLRILTRYAGSKPLDNKMDTIPIENIVPLVRFEVGNAFSPREVKNNFERIILEYLDASPKVLTDFIFNAYIGIINIDLITREQEIPAIDFSEKVDFLLLDTSFIVPLLCKTDPKYQLSVSLCNQCKKMKIPIFFTHRTKTEILNTIVSSKQEASSLHKGYRGGSSNQFILDYLNQKENTSWSAYILLLENWEKTLSEKWNIKLFPESLIPPTDPKCHNKIKNYIKVADEFRYQERHGRDIDYQPRRRNEYLYDHDAYCISLIHSYKKRSSKNTQKKWQWFLTYDNLLSFINYSQLKEYDEIGYVIQPKTFLNYLFAYSKIRFSDEDIEKVKIAILKYTVRESTNELSLENYSKLVSLKIDFGEENSQILKEILLRSPLINELQKALHGDQDCDADNIAYEILSKPNVSDLIKQIVYSEEEKQMDQETKTRLIKELREKTHLIEIKDAQIQILKGANIQQINVNQSSYTNVNVDVSIQENTKLLIQLLEKSGAFNNKKIEKPPEDFTAEKLKTWLGNIRDVISISEDISTEIKSYLPLITMILGNLH